MGFSNSVLAVPVWREIRTWTVWVRGGTPWGFLAVDASFESGDCPVLMVAVASWTPDGHLDR
ncbi:hypothetical protein GCM10009678_92130 [Actinomadura kijaniata]